MDSQPIDAEEILEKIRNFIQNIPEGNLSPNVTLSKLKLLLPPSHNTEEEEDDIALDNTYEQLDCRPQATNASVETTISASPSTSTLPINRNRSPATLPALPPAETLDEIYNELPSRKPLNYITTNNTGKPSCPSTVKAASCRNLKPSTTSDTSGEHCSRIAKPSQPTKYTQLQQQDGSPIETNASPNQYQSSECALSKLRDQAWHNASMSDEGLYDDLEFKPKASKDTVPPLPPKNLRSISNSSMTFKKATIGEKNLVTSSYPQRGEIYNIPHALNHENMNTPIHNKYSQSNQSLDSIPSSSTSSCTSTYLPLNQQSPTMKFDVESFSFVRSLSENHSTMTLSTTRLNNNQAKLKDMVSLSGYIYNKVKMMSFRKRNPTSGQVGGTLGAINGNLRIKGKLLKLKNWTLLFCVLHKSQLIIHMPDNTVYCLDLEEVQLTRHPTHDYSLIFSINDNEILAFEIPKNIPERDNYYGQWFSAIMQVVKDQLYNPYEDCSVYGDANDISSSSTSDTPPPLPRRPLHKRYDNNNNFYNSIDIDFSSKLNNSDVPRIKLAAPVVVDEQQHQHKRYENNNIFYNSFDTDSSSTLNDSNVPRIMLAAEVVVAKQQHQQQQQHHQQQNHQKQQHQQKQQQHQQQQQQHQQHQQQQQPDNDDDEEDNVYEQIIIQPPTKYVDKVIESPKMTPVTLSQCNLKRSTAIKGKLRNKSSDNEPVRSSLGHLGKEHFDDELRDSGKFTDEDGYSDNIEVWYQNIKDLRRHASDCKNKDLVEIIEMRKRMLKLHAKKEMLFNMLLEEFKEKQPNKSENEIHLLASHYVLDRIENDKLEIQQNDDNCVKNENKKKYSSILNNEELEIKHSIRVLEEKCLGKPVKGVHILRAYTSEKTDIKIDFIRYKKYSKTNPLKNKSCRGVAKNDVKSRITLIEDKQVEYPRSCSSFFNPNKSEAYKSKSNSIVHPGSRFSEEIDENISTDDVFLDDQEDDPIYQPTSEHAGVDTDDETSTNMSLVKDYIESHKLVKQRAQEKEYINQRCFQLIQINCGSL